MVLLYNLTFQFHCWHGVGCLTLIYIFILLYKGFCCTRIEIRQNIAVQYITHSLVLIGVKLNILYTLTKIYGDPSKEVWRYVTDSDVSEDITGLSNLLETIHGSVLLTICVLSFSSTAVHEDGCCIHGASSYHCIYYSVLPLFISVSAEAQLRGLFSDLFLAQRSTSDLCWGSHGAVGETRMSIMLSLRMHSAGVHLELVIVFLLDLQNVFSHFPHQSTRYMTIPLLRPVLDPHNGRIYET